MRLKFPLYSKLTPRFHPTEMEERARIAITRYTTPPQMYSLDHALADGLQIPKSIISPKIFGFEGHLIEAFFDIYNGLERQMLSE